MKVPIPLATSCKARLEAAEWFSQPGHWGNVPFLKAEAAKRSFRLGSGATQSTDCYRAQLQQAVEAAGTRNPPR